MITFASAFTEPRESPACINEAPPMSPYDSAKCQFFQVASSSCVRRAASHSGGLSVNIVHSSTIKQARIITVVLGIETSGPRPTTAIVPSTGINVGGSLSPLVFECQSGAQSCVHHTKQFRVRFSLSILLLARVEHLYIIMSIISSVPEEEQSGRLSRALDQRCVKMTGSSHRVAHCQSRGSHS
jgi:hypothetical protein